jgi:hypothetical protein
LTAIQPVFDLAKSFLVAILAHALSQPKRLLQALIDQSLLFFTILTIGFWLYHKCLSQKMLVERPDLKDRQNKSDEQVHIGVKSSYFVHPV